MIGSVRRAEPERLVDSSSWGRCLGGVQAHASILGRGSDRRGKRRQQMAAGAARVRVVTSWSRYTGSGTCTAVSTCHAVLDIPIKPRR
jgi:hypothetical protein